MSPSAKLPQADHRLRRSAPLNHFVMISDVSLEIKVLDYLPPRRAQAPNFVEMTDSFEDHPNYYLPVLVSGGLRLRSTRRNKGEPGVVTKRKNLFRRGLGGTLTNYKE